MECVLVVMLNSFMYFDGLNIFWYFEIEISLIFFFEIFDVL